MFKSACHNFRKLEGVEPKSRELQSVVDRSPFQMEAVVDLADAEEEVGWKQHDDVCKVVDKRTKCMYFNQFVEVSEASFLL